MVDVISPLIRLNPSVVTKIRELFEKLEGNRK